MDAVLQDLRFALRSLLKVPGFTLVAVLTLALGIGANTTIFSIVSALVLDAVPFEEAERLVNLDHVNERGMVGVPIHYRDYERWRRDVTAFESLSARAFQGYTLSHAGSDRTGALKVSGYRITPGFFATLGARPLLGRGFVTEEAEAGRDGVVVLSEQVWARHFGADVGILGRTVLVDGAPRTVVGIMRGEHRFPSSADLWVPLVPTEAEQGYRFLGVIGRLKPGATLEQARAEVLALQDAIERERPEEERVAGTRVVLLTEQQTEYQGPMLAILLVIVGCVLLIACANVAAMLLARATARRQEIAVRASLGAGRGRIVRQLLTESLLLALLAGALGALLGLRGVQLLRDAVPAWMARGAPGWDGIGVDGPTLGYTLVVTILTGLVFGLAPALHAVRVNLAGVLRDGSRGATGRRTARTQRVLVTAEIALAVMLLASAGLLVRSFIGLAGAESGFGVDGVLTLQVALPAAQYDDPGEVVTFEDRLLERVRALPGVREAGLVSHLPMSRTGARRKFRVADSPVEWADWRPASRGYISALGIPLLRGRDFTIADREGAPRVAIVSRALERRHFPDGGALGARLEVDGEAWEIVGVVGDVAHYGPRFGRPATIYVPHAQAPPLEAFVVVRAEGEPAALAGSVRREVAALDRSVAVARVSAMEEVVADFQARERLMAVLLTLFAALAVGIAAIGLYAVVAYAVERRRHEFGIRIALGARAGDVVRVIARWVLVPVAVGTTLGLLGSLGIAQGLARMLYGVSPTDPTVLAATVLVLVATVVVAGAVPTRRALASDPAATLREE